MDRRRMLQQSFLALTGASLLSRPSILSGFPSDAMLAQAMGPQLSAPAVASAGPQKRLPAIRGIYIPGWWGVSSKRIGEIAAFMRTQGLNTIMIDVKDAGRGIYHESANKEANSYLYHLGDGTRRALAMDALKKTDMHLIARHVMFNDHKLYDAHPKLRVFADRFNIIKFVEPRSRFVLDYNYQLLEEEAAMGFDEIVLDYIRFPERGIKLSLEEKCNHIDSVVKEAKRVVGNVDLSVQVFGWVCWGPQKSRIGQRLETLADHVKAIYPMLYPTHFSAGSLGYAKPWKHPREVYEQGYTAAKKRVQNRAEIRPMLEAFNLRSRGFDMVQKIPEMLAAMEGKEGYCYWSPGARYSAIAEQVSSLTRLS